MSGLILQMNSIILSLEMKNKMPNKHYFILFFIFYFFY